LEDELSPELLDPLFSPLMPGVEVEVTMEAVVNCWTELLVMTDSKVWLLLTVVKVVTTATVLLVVSSVVMTEVTGVAEVVGVEVDVDTTTVVFELVEVASSDDVVWMLVDVSVTVEVDWDVGVIVVTEALDVSEEDVSEAEDVPPVLNETLWRFAIAMATSRSPAETDEAAKSARRSVIASERMLTVNSARQAAIKMVRLNAQVARKRAKEGVKTNGLDK
jgi:hypothetical protein